jgi:hypothetical protein
MITKACIKCGNLMSDRITVCPHCKTYNETTFNSKKPIIILLVVVILISVVFLIYNLVRPSSFYRTASDSTTQSSTNLLEMSSADHLLAAKKLMPTNYNQAKKHLDAIPNNSPEYAEAVSLKKDFAKTTNKVKNDKIQTSDDIKLQQLEKNITVRRNNLKKYYATTDDTNEVGKIVAGLSIMKGVYATKSTTIEKRLYSKASSLLPEYQILLRETYASAVEEIFVRKGMDMQVRAVGDSKKTLRLTYALMSQPLVYQYQNVVRIDEEAKKAGFSRLVYTNGFESSLGRTWTVDLE